MAVDRASDNPFPSVLFAEHVDPSNPAAGYKRLFVDTDHIMKTIDSSGTIVQLGQGLTDPMTTRGDIIYRNASNVTDRLAIGSSGKVLSSDGTDVSWQTPASGSVATDTIWDAAGDLALGTGNNTASKLTIGTSGYVLTSNGTTAAWAAAGAAAFDGCVIRKTSNFSHNSSGSFLAVTFDTDDVDTASYHDTSSNTSRITVPRTGKYRFSGEIEWDTNTGGTDRGLQLYLNGTTEVAWDRIVPGSNGSTQRIHRVISLTASDYMELRGFQQSGGTRTIAYRANTGPRFECEYLGA